MPDGDWGEEYLAEMDRRKAEGERAAKWRTRAEAAEAALEVLVRLKDGARDEDYQRRKPLAWHEARRVLHARPH